MATLTNNSIQAPRPPARKPGQNIDSYFQQIDVAERRASADAAQAVKDKRPQDPYAGEVVLFPVADGYAEYLVVSSKPLKLQHLIVGDAWQASPATIRGFRLSDLEARARRAKLLPNIEPIQ